MANQVNSASYYLTDKERQVLLEKAMSMGIDLDEFEMVLDAKLYEAKNKKN